MSTSKKVWEYRRCWMGLDLALIGHEDFVAFEVDGKTWVLIEEGGEEGEEEELEEGARVGGGAATDSDDSVRRSEAAGGGTPKPQVAYFCPYCYGPAARCGYTPTGGKCEQDGGGKT